MTTIDLNNLPNPAEYKLSEFPGINEETIRTKVCEGAAEWLIALFNFNNRAKHRAEMLAQVYFAQMESYKQKMDEMKPNAKIRERPEQKRTSQSSSPLLIEDL